MALQNINPTSTAAWKKLEIHYSEIHKKSIADLFIESARATEFSIQWQDFYVDFSKNLIDTKTKNLLIDLAKECQLTDAILQYFDGSIINSTENRSVLHTALRASKSTSINVDGENIIPLINEVKQKIKNFSSQIIHGDLKGYSNKSFTDVVNIGIGGSDLGPAMVVDALQFYQNHLNVHFVSNVDGDHIAEVLKKLNPETTLFVLVSKTFTTQEMLTNAESAKEWFLKHAALTDVAKHFVAVSTNLRDVAEFGIDANNIFPLWDWVGGRFSLWSAVGLSISIGIGYENFENLLSGANEMDQHFKTASLENNIPVQLALISIWYNNFFGAETEAIIPYSQYLHKFVSYLQQGVMESNGKSVNRNGKKVNYQTGTIIWGETGTNAQHAFFQLIHQGTKIIPTDFIGFTQPLHENIKHHDILMSNFFAQTQALMNGKTASEVGRELEQQQVSPNEIEKILPFKEFSGNRPTNTILIKKLTPRSLGSLIAMYEHKIFVQGVIWNIYSFDQWGVELGKQLATNILEEISNEVPSKQDLSTAHLIKHYIENKINLPSR